MSEQKMLPIWFFVGLMLTLFGMIITATGFYFVFKPQSATVLARLNPNLWWGAIMLLAGLAFLLPSLKKVRLKKL